MARSLPGLNAADTSAVARELARPFRLFGGSEIVRALPAGYFGLRENKALDELATHIAPVPDITDVLNVPTGPELQAIAMALTPFAIGKRPRLTTSLQFLHAF